LIIVPFENFQQNTVNSQKDWKAMQADKNAEYLAAFSPAV
jgi:hypothetical protein